MLKNIFTTMLLLLLVGSVNLFAQDLYMPRDVRQALKNETRSRDGRPGKNYWQNTADYKITINVAPPNRTVRGSEEIVYFNNSPNALDKIVVRLTMNSHTPQASRENEVSPDYLTSGVTIDEYRENGAIQNWKQQNARTWQTVNLSQRLSPGASVKLFFKWHYEVSTETNREGAIDPTTFFLAYFYPRVSVYDDIDGWDQYNFTEGHEFYNDFNNYEVEINTPKNFIVWGTGDLSNPDENLQPEFSKRLKNSYASDDVIHIATFDELSKKSVTLQKDALTWKFKAENISDVAFNVSDHYIWDGGSVVIDKKTNRRAGVQAAYNKEAKDFQKMVEYGKHALDWCSNNYPGVPYPFSKTTIVRGFADMEYPMMVNDSTQQNPLFSRFVVEHEILHSWFPFYMGINEQRYGFMDEGWTTAFELLIARDDMGREAADNFFKQFRVAGWINDPSAEQDLPIIIPGESRVGSGFGNNEYGKSALAYHALKDLLGDEQFKKGLHEFMSRWHGKHPIPWDM
ncbi:MAG: M1 family metallopeptidase, partial [Pyrinomonadaceae bacterium]